MAVGVGVGPGAPTRTGSSLGNPFGPRSQEPWDGLARQSRAAPYNACSGRVASGGAGGLALDGCRRPVRQGRPLSTSVVGPGTRGHHRCPPRPAGPHPRDAGRPGDTVPLCPQCPPWSLQSGCGAGQGEEGEGRGRGKVGWVPPAGLAGLPVRRVSLLPCLATSWWPASEASAFWEREGAGTGPALRCPSSRPTLLPPSQARDEAVPSGGAPGAARGEGETPSCRGSCAAHPDPNAPWVTVGAGGSWRKDRKLRWPWP